MADFAEEFKVSLIADLRTLEANLAEARGKTKAMADKMNQDSQIRLKVNIAEIDAKIAETRRKLTELRKDGNKAGEIKARFEISELQKNKAEASRLLKDLQKDATNTGSSFFKLNSIVTDAIKAFGAFALIRKTGDELRSAFDASVNFESAFAGIRKTIDASEAEFGKLSDQFRGLAKEIPLSVEGLSQIGEIAGQLGVKKDDIVEFTKTIAAIGVSTNLSTEEAATSFARIANIFQAPIEQVGNLASSVVALGNNFATSESEIVNFTTRIAGAGKVAGLSQSDLAGISAAFTSVGVEAEAGGTAVAKTLQSISDAVINGGKDLGNFAQVAGVSAQDFANLWRSAPAQAFDLFIKGLGKSGEQASGILEELVAGDERLKRAFLSVAGAGDLLTKTLELSGKAFSENSALQSEAEKRYATTESQLIKLGNRFNDIKINAGNFLKQVAVPVLEFFVTLAEALGGAQNSHSGLADVLKSVGVALTALLSINAFSKFAQGLQDVGSKISLVAENFKKGQASATGFRGVINGLIGAMGGPLTAGIGLAITAVGLLAGAFFDAQKRAFELEVATKNLNKSLNDNLKTPTLENTKNNFQQSVTTNKQANDKFTSNAPTKESFDSAKQSAADLRVEIENLLGALGSTNQETADFTSQLDLFKGSLTLTKEDTEKLTEKQAELSAKYQETASQFQTSVEAQVAAGATWKDAIASSVEANKKKFGENVKNADDMVKGIQETFVANVAKSGDVGKAAMIAYSSGFSSSNARKTISDAVGGLTDKQLLIQLNAAVKSGDRGQAAGLLYALGVGDSQNLKEVETGSGNLANAVMKTFDSAKTGIFSSGKGSGQSLVGGIISGIKERIPFLSNIISKIASALGGFANIGNVFGAVSKQIPAIGGAVALLEGSFKSFANKAENLKKQFEGIQNAGGDGKGTSSGLPSGGGGKGGGGGGANKALEEAKKKASEAEKAVEDFNKALEESNKAAEKLRNDAVEFYKDIVNSIDEAREKQAELTGELEKFKAEQTNDFAKKSAERDVELQQKQEDLVKKLADAQAELNDQIKEGGDATAANDTAKSNALKEQIIAQQKLNEAIASGKNIEAAQLAADKAAQKVKSLGDKSQDILSDGQKKQIELQEKVTEIQEQQNKILLERQQIQDFLNGLTKDTQQAQQAYNDALKSGDAQKIASTKAALDKANADKAAFDSFTEQRKRETLTEFEQNKLELDDKIKAKETEVEAEKAKQQKIIDIQTQFLALQNAKTADELKKKQDLIDLATTDELLSQEEKKKRLEALGFGNLTVDEQKNLFDQVAKANQFDIELQSIEDQQKEIFETRQKYLDLAAQYQGEKIDEMKQKEQELIDLIKQAQAEQIKLNELGGISGKAGSVVTNTTNVNVNNTIANNVDFEAGNNNLLRKIK